MTERQGDAVELARIRGEIDRAIDQLERIAEFTDLPERQLTTMAIREVANSLRVTAAKMRE